MKARIPKGMGGGPQNMQAMLKQAQKMQEDIVKFCYIIEPKTQFLNVKILYINIIGKIYFYFCTYYCFSS